MAIDIDAIKDLGGIPESDVDAMNSERPTMIPRLIASIYGIIKTYLRKQYKVPLPEPEPEEIVFAVVSWVVYQLVFLKRGVNVTDAVAQEVKANYEFAKKWIEDLSDGKCELDFNTDLSPSVDEGGPALGTMSGPYQFLDDARAQRNGGDCGCD
jgi:phage gp36-like protein